MPFLPPNQQRQSTEGISRQFRLKIIAEHWNTEGRQLVLSETFSALKKKSLHLSVYLPACLCIGHMRMLCWLTLVAVFSLINYRNIIIPVETAVGLWWFVQQLDQLCIVMKCTAWLYTLSFCIGDLYSSAANCVVKCITWLYICSNAANCVMKCFAWLYTGSHSMFSEFVHSFADTVNQVCSVSSVKSFVSLTRKLIKLLLCNRN